MTIAKEGLNLIFAFLAFAVGFGLLKLWPLAGLSGVITLFLLFFFRDPKRIPPADPDVIVSPADGKVLEIKEDDGIVRVTIFMSLWDVHVNRVPYGGEVESVVYQPGKFMPAYKPETHEENEQNIITISSDIGSYRFRQIAGILARRVVCHLRKGQRVHTGERCGVVKFGSRAEVELPADKVDIVVTPGDRVRAGATVIGRVRRGN